MIYLKDPKPYLTDTAIWTSMLQHTRINGQLELTFMLWTIRDMGTVVRNGKLVPLVHPGSGWENEQEFQEIAIPQLKPYAATIKTLIERAIEDDPAKQNGSKNIRAADARA